MNENRYELIVEELQRRLDAGEITYEDAEICNEYAYAKYVEGCDDESIARGEAVIGADCKSSTKANDSVAKKAEIAAKESNVSPDKGLGSKKYSGDILDLIALDDSQKESEFASKMNATKLKVYEAFDAGVINEDEKYTMLEMLDLENYE